MDRTITADIAAPAAPVAKIVGNLETYPEWLELVTEANQAVAEDADEGPAWVITLRAKIGPFSRSKRLRMVRTATGPTGHVFERREVDGRDHSSWVMSANVHPGGANADAQDSSCVEITLSYGGSLWSGALESVLGSVLNNAGERLSEFASQPQRPTE